MCPRSWTHWRARARMKAGLTRGRLGVGRGGKPSAHDQSADHRRHEDRIERGSPLLRPVDIAQMNPQGELVQGQSQPHTEHGREDLGPRTPRLHDEGEETRADQQPDAPHEMVQMKPAPGLHASRPPRHPWAADQPRARANEQKRDDKRNQQHKPDALPPTIEKVRGKLEPDRDQRTCTHRLAPGGTPAAPIQNGRISKQLTP